MLDRSRLAINIRAYELSRQGNTHLSGCLPPSTLWSVCTRSAVPGSSPSNRPGEIIRVSPLSRPKQTPRFPGRDREKKKGCERRMGGRRNRDYAEEGWGRVGTKDSARGAKESFKKNTISRLFPGSYRRRRRRRCSHCRRCVRLRRHTAAGPFKYLKSSMKKSWKCITWPSGAKFAFSFVETTVFYFYFISFFLRLTDFCVLWTLFHSIVKIFIRCTINFLNVRARVRVCVCKYAIKLRTDISFRVYAARFVTYDKYTYKRKTNLLDN